MTTVVCACWATGKLCVSCAERTFDQLGGAAESQGIRWADEVWARTPIALHEKPWPQTPRACLQARARAEKLSTDERLCAMLTEAVTKGAAHRWEQLREQIEIAKKIMDENREALAKLAD